MNTLEYFTLIFGFLLRLALPIIFTGVIVWILHRMDVRWQKEAMKQVANNELIPIQNIQCWDVHDCSPGRKATCPAFMNPNIPCWEAHRRNGQLQEACLRCAFRKVKVTPIPVGMS